MSGSCEYGAWLKMLARCCNPLHPAYPNYGGRGISVCLRWQRSFQAFLEDVGPRPSKDHQLERRNNNGSYNRTNCYWATRVAQGNNKRNNRWISFRGERLTIAQWAARLGISWHTLEGRLSRWSVHRALTEPVRQRRRPT